MCRGTYSFSKPLSVESIAYSHGLFCASHPKFVISMVVFVVIVSSLPFFVTTSGDLNSPKTWKSQWLNYRSVSADGPQWIVNDIVQFSARTPSWFIGFPLAVIQQVYVRLDLACGEEDMVLCRKSQFSKSRIAASHLINRMEDTIEICRSVFHPAALNLSQTLTHPPTPHPHPTHSGVLSPSLDSLTNKWDKSHNSTLGYHSLKELLYGGFWELEHHLSRREGVVSGGYQQHVFGLTFVLNPSREGFNNMTKCLDTLKSKWPRTHHQQEKPIQHFYFEPEWRLIDFAPLILLYSTVFLYISFSVGKIDLVKSKVGLGITACLTVVASLTMSLGICTFFGVSISLSGSEIYPYVVITIGLENILIMVKAVISTPEELEVKYRIAVGLSKESWAILQNLLTLLCMMSLSLLVFNYTMREFCVLALVGVLCDAFLQLVFFTTVLSVDLRRLELSDLSSQPIPDPSSIPDSPGGKGSNPCPSSVVLTTSKKWRSKRVKFFYFLARVRPVSRSLMVAFSVVMLAWFTNTETFHNIVTDLMTSHPATSSTPLSPPGLDMPISDSSPMDHGMSQEELVEEPSLKVPADSSQLRESEERQSGMKPSSYYFDSVVSLNESDVFVGRVRSEDVTDVSGVWRDMVTTHWPRLLRYAGFNLHGRFLTLLPPISLTLHIGFPTPPTPSLPPTPTLAHLIFSVYNLRVMFLLVLGISVVMYVSFLIISTIRRHQQSLKRGRQRRHTGRVVCLRGHKQDIECVCVDGGVLVSASLDGDLRVWSTDPGNKRCLRTITRSELCGEPPPNSATSNTSNRLAADGCEDEPDNTPTATPQIRSKGKGLSTTPQSVPLSSLPLQPLLSHSPQQSQPPTHPSQPTHPSHYTPISQSPQTSPTPISPFLKKFPSINSLSSLPHQQHLATPPPISPVNSSSFNAFSTAIPLPVYYTPAVSAVQSEISRANEYRNPSAVHVVTATPVIPTPQQACVALSNQIRNTGNYQYTAPQAALQVQCTTHYTAPQTQYTTPQAQYTTPQTQYTAPQAQCTTQYIAPQVQHTTFQTQYTGYQAQYTTTQIQYITAPAQYTAPQTTAQAQCSTLQTHFATPQTQYTSITQSQFSNNHATTPNQSQQFGSQAHPQYRPSGGHRTHSRALSHGHLSFHQPPPVTTHGRASHSHVSLQVTEDAYTNTSYPLPTPHGSQGVQPDPTHSGSPVSRHGYLQRHSTQGNVSIQRAHSLGSRSDLNSSRTQAVGRTTGTPYTTYSLPHTSSATSSRHESYSSLQSTDSSTHSNLAVSFTHLHNAGSSVVTRPHSASSYPTSVHTNSTAGERTRRISTPISSTPSDCVQVPLHPPVISTPRVTQTLSDTSALPVSSTASHPSTASTIQHTKSHEASVTSSSEQSSGGSVAFATSSSVLTRSTPYRRGHIRNHSLGNDLPHRCSLGHARNRSLGSIAAPFLPKTLSSRQASIGNLSMASVHSFLLDSPALPQTPNSETGYDFAAHFNLFSPYTANMAIQYISVSERSPEPEPKVPPVWCMDVWNRTIAVGCGNGQVEAWNADTGSLIFCLNLGPVGMATVAITSQGIYTGHMDGVMTLIGHNGLLKKSVHIHSEAISVLRCHGDRVITGSYDSIVSVFRSLDLVQVTSVHGHYGSIRDIICIDGPTRGCVSGCSKGLVLHWDVDNGECINDYGMYEGGVVKLGWTGTSIVALFTDCLRVWDSTEGSLRHSISLNGLCNNFTVMGSKYIVASFESHMVVYDMDSGREYSEQYLQSDRAVALINHVLTLDEANVVCSSGKDLHIVPCHVKLKTD